MSHDILNKNIHNPHAFNSTDKQNIHIIYYVHINMLLVRIDVEIYS